MRGANAGPDADTWTTSGPYEQFDLNCDICNIVDKLSVVSQPPPRLKKQLIVWRVGSWFCYLYPLIELLVLILGPSFLRFRRLLNPTRWPKKLSKVEIYLCDNNLKIHKQSTQNWLFHDRPPPDQRQPHKFEYLFFDGKYPGWFYS